MNISMSEAGTSGRDKSNCISQYSVECNYLYLPKMPASGTKVLIQLSGFNSLRVILTHLGRDKIVVIWQKNWYFD